MTNDQINEVINSGYNPTKCNDYRAIYNIWFAPKKASTCNCSCSEIFNNIKIKQLNELNTKNPNQTKNEKGQFQKVNKEPAPIAQTTEAASTAFTAGTTESGEYILKVKQELIEGYLDPERITKAYKLIMNDDSALSNMRVMKNTILNYDNNFKQ